MLALSRFIIQANPQKALSAEELEIRQWIKSGNIEKMENLVLEGQGAKLLGLAESTGDTKVKNFLKSVPGSMAKIDIIHEAVVRGSRRETQALIDKRKWASAKDSSGRGLAHKAVLYNHKAVVEWLAKKYPETIEIRDNDLRTALHYSATLKESELMYDRLVNFGANSEVDDARGKRPIYYLTHPDELGIESPIFQGQGKSSKTVPPKISGPPPVVTKSQIRLLIHERDVGSLEKIVWSGNGDKLLSEASTIPIIRKFLGNVPQLLARIKSVHQAAIVNDLASLREIKLKTEIDEVFTAKDSKGLTAMHKSAGLGYREAVEFFIYESKTLLNDQDNEGRTPLHYAARNTDMYTFLIRSKADTKIEDYKGNTAEYYKSNPSEIDYSLLKILPDAPRASGEITGWDRTPVPQDVGGVYGLVDIKKITEDKEEDGKDGSEDENKEEEFITMESIIKGAAKIRRLSETDETIEGAKNETVVNSDEIPPEENAAEITPEENTVEPSPPEPVSLKTTPKGGHKSRTPAKALKPTSKTPVTKEKEPTVEKTEELKEPPLVEESPKPEKARSRSKSVNKSSPNKKKSVLPAQKPATPEPDPEPEEDVEVYIQRGGNGDKLLSEASTIPIIRKFLGNVPQLLARIKSVHQAAIVNDLASLREIKLKTEIDEVFTAKDSKGLTAMHKSAGLGYREAVEFFIYESKTLLNDQDNEGRTPLHYAARNTDMYTFLIRSKADTKIEDYKGNTAEYYKSNPSEIDYSLLKILPDAPRASGEITGWDRTPVPQDVGGVYGLVDIKKITEDKEEDGKDGSEDENKEEEFITMESIIKGAAKIRRLSETDETIEGAKNETVVNSDEIPPEENAAEITPEENTVEPSPPEPVSLKTTPKGGHKSRTPAKALKPTSKTPVTKEKEPTVEKTEELKEPPLVEESPKPEKARSRSKSVNKSSPNKKKSVLPAQKPATPEPDPEPEEDVEVYIQRGDMAKLVDKVLGGRGSQLVGKSSNNPEVQEFLLNVPAYIEKIQAIHKAASSGNLKDLQSKLDRERLALAQDEYGRGPLHKAILHNHIGMVRFLSSTYPTTVALGDRDNRTALHYAATLSDSGVIYKSLIQAGGDPNQKDRFGNTAGVYLRRKDLLTQADLLAVGLIVPLQYSKKKVKSNVDAAQKPPVAKRAERKSIKTNTRM